MGGCRVPATLLIVMHLFAFAALGIAGATYTYYLVNHEGSWKIRTGYKPDQNVNAFFFFNFAAVGFAIISYLYCLVELLMLFKIKQLKVVDAGFTKPIVYIVNGICILGLCGDLGIAAGALTMAAGVMWLIFGLVASMD